MSKQVNPNPQGKAALPHLGELQAWRDVDVRAANPEKVVVDYLCGLLVLSADFSFKPVPGPTYHLYLREGCWQLSLVAPEEWRPTRWHDYVAGCELQHDATWRISPADGLEKRRVILEALFAFEQAFRERMQSAQKLVDDLPVKCYWN